MPSAKEKTSKGRLVVRKNLFFGVFKYILVLWILKIQLCCFTFIFPLPKSVKVKELDTGGGRNALAFLKIYGKIKVRTRFLFIFFGGKRHMPKVEPFFEKMLTKEEWDKPDFLRFSNAEIPASDIELSIDGIDEIINQYKLPDTLPRVRDRVCEQT